MGGGELGTNGMMCYDLGFVVHYNQGWFFQGNTIMPYVNIRIAGTLTRDQKARISAEITDTLERIALKPKGYTYIAFDELPDENWAIAGKLLDEE